MTEQTDGSSNDPSDRPLAAGWGFWLWWVLASTTAWGVGGPLGVEVGSSGDRIAAGYVGVALGGIVAGALQGLVLRRHLARAAWWALAGVVAVTGVGAVVFGLGVVNADAGWVAGAAAFGSLVGVLQWLVLKRQLARAGWWVLASTVGWLVGGPLSGFVSWAVGAPVDGPVAGFVGWAALGAAYGAITGPVLIWLLRQKVPMEHPARQSMMQVAAFTPIVCTLVSF